MSLEDHKLTQANTTIQDLADYPAQSGLTAQQLKAKFDEYPEKLRRTLNSLIDELAASYPDQSQLESILAGTGLLSEHLGQLAGESYAGHVRLDGRTVALNDQGQLVALGGETELASLDEALIGTEQSKVMSPYLVKEAITQHKQRVQYALQQLWQSDLQIMAADWHEGGGYLAAALAEGDSYAVVLYAFDGQQLRESSRVTIGGPVASLAWREFGTMVGYRLTDGSIGLAAKSGSSLSAVTPPAVGATRLLGWESSRSLVDRRLVVVTEAEPRRLQYYADTTGSWLLDETVDFADGGEMGELVCFAFMPLNGFRLALVDQLQGQYRLRFFNQELAGVRFQAEIDLAQRPTDLVWRPGGGLVAVGYGEGDLALQLFGNNHYEQTVRLLDSLPGAAVNSVSWHKDKQMLVVGYEEAEPAYALYFYNGQALEPITQGFWPGVSLRPRFHRGRDNLLLLGWAAGQGGLRIQELTREVTQRFLPVQQDLQAQAYGDYILPQGKLCQVSCPAAPQPGQYFRFLGAYPQEVSLDGGAYPLRDSLSDTGVYARGQGLYQVIFLEEESEAGGYWRVLPLSRELADEAQAQAAEDDTRALTPYGGGQLLAARGRRAATVVVAAADSLNPQAADFVCTGESDQLTLKAALAALPESGGRLVLLDGTFTFDAAGAVFGSDSRTRLLSVDKPRVSISGQGASTRLRLAAGIAQISGNQIVMCYVDAADFVCEDCCFDGNRYSNNHYNLTALDLGSQAQRAEVRRTHFTGCSGVALRGLQAQGRIRASWFYDNAGGLESAQGDLWIADNEFRDHDACAVYCQGGQDSLQDNRFRSNQVALELLDCRDSMLTGNQFLENTSGMLLRNCNSIYVKDNYVRRGKSGSNYGANEYSLLIDGSQDIMMVGNWLRYKASTPVNDWKQIWASFSGSDWNPDV